MGADSMSEVRSWPVGAGVPPPSTRKRVVLLGIILDLARQHAQPVTLGAARPAIAAAESAAAARRAASALVTTAMRSACGSRAEPALALGEALRVRRQ